MNKYRKRKRCLFLLGWAAALMMTFAFGICASAENPQKVTDGADLLTTEEEEKLQERLAQIAETYECDVAVATTDSCGGKSPQDYTDDFYYENGYGYGEDIDGIILMVSMGERKFHLATRGKAIRIFTDYGLEQIDEAITEYLSDGEYYDAFTEYADMVEEFIIEAENGTPYDVDHEYERPMEWWFRILISMAVGIVAALVVFLVLRHQLKSVAPGRQAAEYVRDGSFRVKRERDVFLYRTVSRHKIERHEDGGGGGSSTHSTSDGGSAGGHTGSF